MLLGIRHAAIVVSDLQKSLNFYRELGFRAFYDGDADWAMLEISGTSLSLIQGAPNPPKKTGSHPAHLGINFSARQDIDDLRKKFPSSHAPRIHRDGSYGFYFEDLDGNQFEAIYIPPLLLPTNKSVMLLAHGSRDPEWRKPFEKWLAQLQSQSPKQAWSLAYLEMAAPTLRDAIQKEKSGAEVLVIPLFFSDGAHVRRDIPEQVAECAKLRPDLKIKISPAIGSQPLFQSSILDAVCDAVRESSSVPGR